MQDKRLETLCPAQLDLRLSFLRTFSAGSSDKMMASLTKRGQLAPITVVSQKDSLILVDGFKRHRAAVNLGLDALMSTVVTAGTVESKAMIYLLNRPDTFSVINEAILIRELIEVEGLTQTETASLLDRHKSWVSRRLMMIRSLGPEIIEDMQLKLLPPGVGPSLARLPRGNQTDFSAAIQNHGLQSREIRRLVDLWCRAKDPAIRHWLLESPRQALEIAAGDDTDTPEAWLSQLLAISRKIARLGSEMEKTKMPEHIAASLLGLFKQMTAQIEQISTPLKQEEK